MKTTITTALETAKLLPVMMIDGTNFSDFCESAEYRAAHLAAAKAERKGDAVSAALADRAALAWLESEPTALDMIAARVAARESATRPVITADMLTH